MIYDLINYLNTKNPWLLLWLDFKKAFDSLAWQSMFKVLRVPWFWEKTFVDRHCLLKHKVNGNSEWTDNSIVYSAAWVPTRRLDITTHIYNYFVLKF